MNKVIGPFLPISYRNQTISSNLFSWHTTLKSFLVARGAKNAVTRGHRLVHWLWIGIRSRVAMKIEKWSPERKWKASFWPERDMRGTHTAIYCDTHNAQECYDIEYVALRPSFFERKWLSEIFLHWKDIFFMCTFGWEIFTT